MTRRAKRLSSIEMGSTVHEIYALHYLMFNLGFTPEEVFVQACHVANWSPPGIYAVVTLRSQGKEYVYVVWPLIRDDVARFERYWSEFSRRQPQLTDDQKDHILAGSDTMKQFGVIARNIAAKGFVIPEVLLRKFTDFDWAAEVKEELPHPEWKWDGPPH